MKSKQSYEIDVNQEVLDKYRLLGEELDFEPESELAHCVEDYIASLKAEIED
jgi:hypothetical protein